MSIIVGTNSYVSIASADTYFGSRFNSGSWSSASDTIKTGSLLSAATLLEQQDYIGNTTATDQDMKWPRAGVLNRNGTAFESDATTPQRVKNAQYEWAFALIVESFQLTPEPRVPGTYSAGGVSAPLDDTIYLNMPPQVAQELEGLLANGSPLNFSINR